MNAVVEEVRKNVTEFRVPGPGERLRCARLAAGLELAAVATRLHLDEGMVEYLERDQYDLLPERVFVQGYVRNYARLVGLPPESVLKQLDEHCPVSEERQFENIGKHAGTEMRNGGLLVRVITLAVALGTAALFFVWWKGYLTWLENEVPPETTAAATVEAPMTEADGSLRIPQQPTAPAASKLEASSGAPLAATRSPESVESEISPQAPSIQRNERALHEPQVSAMPALQAAVTNSASPPVSTLDKSQSTAAAPIVMGDQKIVLEFSEPCWVDVRDSTRDFKLFGEMPKGARKVLGGAPPYKVVIGKASAVQVTVDSALFDIKRYARGNVARFTLDPSSMR